MTPSTQDSLETFFRSFPPKSYNKGHIFILPNEPIDTIYYVTEGKMKVYDVSYRGDEIIINTRKAPGFFPLSLVTPATINRYIYEADSDITVRQAPIKAVETYLSSHPAVVLDLLSYVYTILDGVLERMVYFIEGNAKNRLVYALLNECREFGVIDERGYYHLAITERELGARAGLSRETVSREARYLKRMKLLEVNHNDIIIRDMHILEQYLTPQRHAKKPPLV